MKLRLGTILWSAVILLMVAGCFEWKEDSQGNLKSFGVPGVPLWKASPSPVGEVGPNVANDSDPLQMDSTQTGAEPDWLIELNRIRANSGLQPVGENVSLSNDCVANARYLVENGPHDPAVFRQYTVALGAAAHKEDPANQLYSAAGAECAQGGRLNPLVFQAGDVAYDRNPVADIDGLFVAPFHRLSLVAPWATVAGYGSYGQFPQRAAALALRGGYTKKVELVKYPGDGAILNQGWFYLLEYPSVLSSCPGYQLPTGLPITVQAGRNHVMRLKAYSVTGPNGEVEACGIDPFNYQSHDPGEAQHAQRSLELYGALIIVPRHPLVDGQYAVSITTEAQTIVWSFSVKNAVPFSPQNATWQMPGAR
jgi:hypothetical protein